MAEITSGNGVVTLAVTTTAASVGLTRAKNTTATGISGHSEIAPNAPAGVKVKAAAGAGGASPQPVLLRAYGAGTTTTAVTDSTAQFVVNPGESVFIPAGEATLTGANYSLALSAKTRAGVADITAEWVDALS